MKDKIVYILGAGFSMGSGAPSQAEIIKEIFALKTVDFKKQTSDVVGWIDQFDEFIKKGLYVSEAEKIYYTLEDIYTPLDRSIAEGSSFRNYTNNQLKDLREKFDKLIILAVKNAIEKSRKKKTTIEKFAQHVVALAKAKIKDEKDDKVSIVTTNWDIMLDNKIHEILKNEKIPKGKFCGVVDYCCYISSLEEADPKIKPGLYAIGKGGYNVKLIKLHGSLNWLQCPKCQRIYVKYFSKWNGGYVFSKKYCRHCATNFNLPKHPSHQLSTNMVMPTFLKNLDNVQNKLIWQNAGIELSEATKVVFLGYSLPQADFEFKQLLSRMIKPDAKIEVILVSKDDPKIYADPVDKHKDDLKYQTAGYRYTNFFSGRDVTISYDGVAKYVDAL